MRPRDCSWGRRCPTSTLSGQRESPTSSPLLTCVLITWLTVHLPQRVEKASSAASPTRLRAQRPPPLRPRPQAVPSGHGVSHCP